MTKEKNYWHWLEKKKLSLFKIQLQIKVTSSSSRVHFKATRLKTSNLRSYNFNLSFFVTQIMSATEDTLNLQNGKLTLGIKSILLKLVQTLEPAFNFWTEIKAIFDHKCLISTSVKFCFPPTTTLLFFSLLGREQLVRACSFLGLIHCLHLNIRHITININRYLD